jgi:hypothetical protein
MRTRKSNASILLLFAFVGSCASCASRLETETAAAAQGAGQSIRSHEISKDMHERLRGTEEVLSFILAEDFQTAQVIAENKLRLPPDIEKEIESRGHQSSIEAKKFHENFSRLMAALKTQQREKSLLQFDALLKRCEDCHGTLSR